MMHGKRTYIAASVGAAGGPSLLSTAYRLWWIVITLVAAAAALWRLVPRRME
ncbi:hypothetical protein ABZ876_23495 [Streptomyces sp. NPDC046931]|uniref:hypothetical protein n=1 Tax=Streptomyces sp. NPDC046931 TaxID=3154806 RepID=UPI0033E5617F